MERWDGRKIDGNKREKHKTQNAKWERYRASWHISGREELVSAEDRRQHYGNGCLAASLADCKQDLGKAYSLWWGPQSLASLPVLCRAATLPRSLLLSVWFLCSNLPKLCLWVIYEAGWGRLRKRYAHILTPNTWHVPHVFPLNYKEPFCLYKEKETPKRSCGVDGARITLWTAVNQVVGRKPRLRNQN